MILTCKKCKTRFQLKDSLLKPGGSKVRCSQCRHIFTAYPGRDSINPEMFEDIFETPRQTDQPAAPRETISVSSQPSEPPLSLRKDSSQEPDFSRYEQILDQPTPREPDAIQRTVHKTIPVSQKQPHPTITRETVQQPPQARPDQSRHPSPGFIPPPHHPQFKTRPSQKIKKNKSTRLKLPVILLVAVFLITACAYIASLALGYKVPWMSEKKMPFIDSLISEEADQNFQEPVPIVSQADLSSQFVSNETAGELFIISGIVKNPADIAYQHIQVKGTLLAKDQTTAVTKRAFCGNIISKEKLKTAYINEINTLLAKKTGMNGNNTNLPPNASIPFMIVFSNLSDSLSNFTAEVEGFEKVPNQ